MRMTDELDRLVLGAVGDDFVTLDNILDKISAPGGMKGKLDSEFLYSRLLDLIADRLINAYLLHADPPYITPVKITPGAPPTSWFYITQRGRKCLANSSRKRASQQSRSAGAGSQDRYTPAVNF